jgi:hypothetical protein
MSILRRLGVVAAFAGAVTAGTMALPGQAHAWWRGGVGYGVVVPPVVVAPPVYVAPAPIYVAPPPVYAAPPPVYAAPPPVYAVPPVAYNAGPRVWIPAHWQGGYWVPGHWR